MIEQIDKKMVGQILNKNFGFTLNNKFIDIFDCPIIELEAKEGFNFVQTVNGFSGSDGSYYLSADGKPRKPIIYYELFLNEKSILDYYYDFPNLFKGIKYLIPFKFNKTMEKKKFQIIFEEIKSAQLNPEDCIVTEISYAESGSLEAFTEYIASKLLINEGFIVENQAIFPGLQTKGVPDFGAYKIPATQNILIKNDFMIGGGFLHELALLRIFGKVSPKQFQEDGENTFIAGEAKTGNDGSYSIISKKEWKYLSEGYFDRFMQITPRYPRHKEWYDYIEFYKNGKVKVRWSNKKKDILEWQAERKKEIEKCVIQKVKSYLLQNLTFKELLDVAKPAKPKTIYEFYKNLSSLELSQTIELVNTAAPLK